MFGAGSIQEMSVVSSQFSCEPKTALRNKALKEKKNEKEFKKKKKEVKSHFFIHLKK